MGFMQSPHIPFHFHDCLMFPFQDLDDLPPNTIVIVNFKSPSNSFCFTILFSSEFVDHVVVFMVSTTQTFGTFYIPLPKFELKLNHSSKHLHLHYKQWKMKKTLLLLLKKRKTIPQKMVAKWQMWIQFLHNHSTLIITTILHYKHTFINNSKLIFITHTFAIQ